MPHQSSVPVRSPLIEQHNHQNAASSPPPFCFKFNCFAYVLIMPSTEWWEPQSKFRALSSKLHWMGHSQPTNLAIWPTARVGHNRSGWGLCVSVITLWSAVWMRLLWQPLRCRVRSRSSPLLKMPELKMEDDRSWGGDSQDATFACLRGMTNYWGLMECYHKTIQLTIIYFFHKHI